MANDLNKEDGEGCIQHHLEGGVDGNEDGAILVVSASQSVPDKDLVLCQDCILSLQ